MSERSKTNEELPDEEEFFRGATEAVRRAIGDMHSRGIPTAHLIDGKLVLVHPDGRREELGPLSS